MSQTVLPPATPPGSPSGSSAVARRSAMVVVDAAPPAARPTPSPYEPEPPRRPSRFWRAVKWPLRQIIKAIYLTGAAAKRHRLTAVAIVLLLALLGGGTYAIYQYTHPAPQPGPGQQGSGPLGTVSNGQDTPFTIVNASIPLATGAINFLNGFKTGNVQELIANTATRVQAGGTLFNGQQGALSASDWPGLVQYFQSHGVIFQQFDYAGGFIHVDGTASYTIQVIVGSKNQSGILEWTWYLTVGADGKITGWQDLTSAPPQASPTP